MKKGGIRPILMVRTRETLVKYFVNLESQRPKQLEYKQNKPNRKISDNDLTIKLHHNHCALCPSLYIIA